MFLELFYYLIGRLFFISICFFKKFFGWLFCWLFGFFVFSWLFLRDNLVLVFVGSIYLFGGLSVLLLFLGVFVGLYILDGFIFVKVIFLVLLWK